MPGLRAGPGLPWAVMLTVLSLLAVRGALADEPPQVVTGTLAGVHGCEMAYERYPANGYQGRVLLAHGFQRDLSTMRGWARHWQSLGIDTTVMSLCNSTWFNGHHQRNADDLVTKFLNDQFSCVLINGLVLVHHHAHVHQ